MHLLVIGGSDAGISAALRAHELDPTAEVTLAVADEYPNFSICGLPYYLSGETPDWRSLAHRTAFPGINVLRRHTAESIDTARKTVRITHEGTQKNYRYDRLVVATGASPVRPAVRGIECDGVFLLHSMEDSFALHRWLTERAPRSAVLVGAGYIGLEMADALRQRGLEVTLLSRSATVLPTVDPELGRLAGEELRRHGVHVLTSTSALGVERLYGGPHLAVTDSAGRRHPGDLVVFAAGVRPNSGLAERAGAGIGINGAIAVTRHMRTNLTDVFAAGDCVETYHHLLDRPTYISLGTIAHKQGRVAGENAVGGDRRFAGAVGTQSLKLFDLVIARTGLLDHEARAGGFDPLTVPTEASDHKAYYPGAVQLNIRVSGDRSTGRLLGAQIAGSRPAEISKRIDIIATALFREAFVEELNDMDLSYTPPLSSPWDPLQIAAQNWAAAQPATRCPPS